MLKRHTDVVRFLVDSGVNVHKKDIFGHSPIESAVKLQYQDVVDLLSHAPKVDSPSNMYFNNNINGSAKDMLFNNSLNDINNGINGQNRINSISNGSVNHLNHLNSINSINSNNSVIDVLDPNNNNNNDNNNCDNNLINCKMNGGELNGGLNAM